MTAIPCQPQFYQEQISSIHCFLIVSNFLNCSIWFHVSALFFNFCTNRKCQWLPSQENSIFWGQDCKDIWKSLPGYHCSVLFHNIFLYFMYNLFWILNITCFMKKQPIKVPAAIVSLTWILHKSWSHKLWLCQQSAFQEWNHQLARNYSTKKTTQNQNKL